LTVEQIPHIFTELQATLPSYKHPACVPHPDPAPHFLIVLFDIGLYFYLSFIIQSGISLSVAVTISPFRLSDISSYGHHGNGIWKHLLEGEPHEADRYV
jgi:hypothetical protein